MLKVMISSTFSDLEPERAAVHDVVMSLHMYPIDMKDFNASDLSALQVCYDKVQQADILVGIYAHRYGSVPPVTMAYTDAKGKRHHSDGKTSFTHYEYKWAIEKGIPVLLFVLDRDAAWKPAWIEKGAGAEALEAFISGEASQHVYKQFTVPADLGKQVSTALFETHRLNLTTTLTPTPQQTDVDPNNENLDKLIANYFDNLEHQIDQEIPDYVQLTAQRIELTAPPPPQEPIFGRRRPRIALDSLRQPLLADRIPARREDDQAGAPVTADVLTLLHNVKRGAVLLGEPGTGKSWTLQRIVFDYADGWRDADPAERPKCLIPVLIPLNQFNGTNARAGKPDEALSFADFVLSKLDVLRPYLPRLLREDRVIFLCDALNEMPRQSPLRGRDLVAEVRSYLAERAGYQPHFVVSCRVRDYEVKPDLDALKPLEQIRVREFDLPQIRQAIQQRLGKEAGEELWIALAGKDGDLLFSFLDTLTAKGKADQFWEPQSQFKYGVGEWDERQAWRAMHSGARLIPLARNPFMLGVIGDIYEEDGAIPSSRGKLFEGFVALLIKREQDLAARRGESFPDQAAIEAYLVELARRLQDLKTTTLPRADAISLYPDGAALPLVDAALAASILTDDGISLKFSHQLLQEYFAAKILLEALETDEIAGAFDRASVLFGGEWWAGVWRETSVILGEFLGEGKHGPNRVAQWLAPVTPELALEVITRNAGGLTLTDVEPETVMALVQSSRAKLLDLAIPPLGRAAAGRVLGLLNADGREGIGNAKIDGIDVPQIKWCEVPAGEFIMGSDDIKDNPKQTVYVERIQIAKYPVTYKQYQAFIDDGGYKDEHKQWWSGLHPDAQKIRARGPREQAFQYWNHPRETVTWYEAMAFCKWLSSKLGHTVTLPREVQWEKAARGPDGRIYPYGATFDANKGNAGATGIGKTSAVGIFPDEDLPYKVLDMSGNVWELCVDEYGAKPTINVSSININTDQKRVLRGGSWFGSTAFARAGERFGNTPGSVNFSGGFRCARS